MRLLNALSDRMLVAFAPKVTVRATCVTWKQFCYCSGVYGVYRWCDKGCDSTGTTCGSCNVYVKYAC